MQSNSPNTQPCIKRIVFKESVLISNRKQKFLETLRVNVVRYIAGSIINTYIVSN